MTAARRADASELKRFLGSFGPEVAKIALRVRTLVLGEAPLADELVDAAENSVVMGYSFTGRASDAFCHIAVSSGWVRLGFDSGAEIPDPEGRLERAGESGSHIRIESLEGIRQPHVGRLLRAAMRNAPRRTDSAPEPPKGRG